jgi:branched-chain amino acid transport system ATP-binding protein
LTALAIENLVAGYEPGLPIVKGTSIRVEPREIVAILGPNGAGKSTLIKAIAGLLPVTSGTIRFLERDMQGIPAHRLIREGLAFVPQTENVFANLTVAENLELAGFFLGRRRRERLSAMYAFFPDLARQRALSAGRLSGGQRQMLAVARALLVEPTVIMLDEPSAGLSPKLVAQVFEKLAEVRAAGVTILMVEQNVKAALALSDRAYVLVEGKERLEGTSAELGRAPDLAALYLGGAVA